jgi:hypothetical protein
MPWTFRSRCPHLGGGFSVPWLGTQTFSGTRFDPGVNLAFEVAYSAAFPAWIQDEALREQSLRLQVSQLPVADADLRRSVIWS